MCIRDRPSEARTVRWSPQKQNGFHDSKRRCCLIPQATFNSACQWSMTSVNRASLSNLWNRRCCSTAERERPRQCGALSSCTAFGGWIRRVCTCGRGAEGLLWALPLAHQLQRTVRSASASVLLQLLRWGLKEAHPRVERSDMQLVDLPGVIVVDLVRAECLRRLSNPSPEVLLNLEKLPPTRDE